MNTQNKALNLNLDRFSFKIDCSKGQTKLLCSLNLFEIGIDNKLYFNLNIGKMVTGSLFNFGNNVATNFDIQINENLSSAEPYIEIIDPFNFKDYFYNKTNSRYIFL